MIDSPQLPVERMGVIGLIALAEILWVNYLKKNNSLGINLPAQVGVS